MQKELYPFIGSHTLINNMISLQILLNFFYEKQKEIYSHFFNDSMCSLHTMF